MSTPLLAAGYALAVPGTVALLKICRRRWVWAFAGLEVGTACIVAGWWLRGQRLAAAVNAAALVGFAAVWVVTGRRGAQHQPGA